MKRVLKETISTNEHIDIKLNDLNIDVLLQIIACLNPIDLYLLSQVSSFFSQLTREDSIWKKQLLQHYPEEYNAKENHQENFASRFKRISTSRYLFFSSHQKTLFCLARSNDLYSIEQNKIDFYSELDAMDREGINLKKAIIQQNNLDLNLYVYNQAIKNVKSNGMIILYAIQFDQVNMINLKMIESWVDILKQSYLARAVEYQALNVVEFFLQKGINPNDGNNYLIREAVNLNNIKMVALLVKYNAKIDPRDFSLGDSALTLAIKNAALPIVKLLVSKGAKLAPAVEENEPLVVAIKQNKNEIVDYLLPQYSSNYLTSQALPLLRIAAICNNISMAELLLTYFNNNNIKMDINELAIEYPILLDVVKQSHADMVSLRFESCADHPTISMK